MILQYRTLFFFKKLKPIYKSDLIQNKLMWNVYVLISSTKTLVTSWILSTYISIWELHMFQYIQINGWGSCIDYLIKDNYDKDYTHVQPLFIKHIILYYIHGAINTWIRKHTFNCDIIYMYTLSGPSRQGNSNMRTVLNTNSVNRQTSITYKLIYWLLMN